MITSDHERLEALFNVFNLIKEAEADGLNLPSYIPRVLEITIERLSAFTGSLIVVNDDLAVMRAWVVGPDALARPVANAEMQPVVQDGAAGHAIRTRKPVVVDNTQSDPRWLQRPGFVTSTEPTSALSVPLVARGRARGALTMTKTGAGRFVSADIDLLSAIAGQAAVTIDNALLYEESQRRLHITTLLNDAGRVVNSSLDLDEILHRLLEKLNEFFNAEAISIALVDARTQDLVFQVSVGTGSDQIVGLRLPSNEGIAGWVMRHNQAVRVNNVYEDDRFHRNADQRTGLHTQAMICAPLTVRGNVLGTMQVLNPEAGLFTDDDLQFLQQLASMASSSIANAQELRRAQYAESRYINLFEDSVNPIILTTLDGIITDLNQRATQLLGYGNGDLLGSDINRLHVTSVDIETALPTGGDQPRQIAVIENVARTVAGSEIPVEIHIKRTESVDSGVIQWIYYDRSKHVELEQMRQELTAMLFHDLQNPLSNVISSLELLDMEIRDLDFQPDDDIRLMLDVASKSSQRLRHLVLSLLDINLLEAGTPIMGQDFVELERLARNAVDTYSASMETRRIGVAMAFAPDLAPIFANGDMIERVIINLIDNALKFSLAGQTITIAADEAEDGRFVRLSVADEGPGIPEQYRASIFKKFYRTPNNTSKGVGLGLSFCRLAVEGHRGRIWAESAESGGARIVVLLPTTPAPA